MFGRSEPALPPNLRAATPPAIAFTREQLVPAATATSTYPARLTRGTLPHATTYSVALYFVPTLLHSIRNLGKRTKKAFMELILILQLVLLIRRPGQYRHPSAQGRIPQSTLTPSSTFTGLLAGATGFMGPAPPKVHLLFDLARRTFDRWSSRAPATPKAGPTRPTLRPGNVGP